MTQPSSGQAFVLDQTVPAPRDLVFRAWSEPERLAAWWGPRGMAIAVAEATGGVGGSIRYAMGAGGMAMHGRLTFEEVAPPARLVLSDVRLDDAGEPLMDEAFPTGLRYEVTFAEADGGTAVALRVTPLSATAAAQAAFEAHMDGLGGGFRGAFEKLGEYVAAMPPAPGSREPFTVTRVVRAPRDLVFRAWTERDHLARWWGPKEATVGVVSADLRPGGSFHYSMEMGGKMLWARWVIREITPPDRFVYVDFFADGEGRQVPMPWLADFPGQVLHEMLFDEVEGGTRMTLLATPLEASDAEWAAFDSLRTSMIGGYGGTLDQLDAHLATLMR